MAPFLEWPPWASRVVWTGVTVLVAYAAGHALNRVVLPPLAAWLRSRSAVWPDELWRLLRGRLPFWSGLGGIWIATNYWPLGTTAHFYIDRALFVVGAVSVTLTVSAVARHLVSAYGRVFAPRLPATSLTSNLAAALVAVLGLLAIFNTLGISITPMLTALGVGGLAVALALQEPLANLFAGLFVTMAGQIRVGDYVKLDSGHEGYVADFDWRSTRLRMLANNIVVVPNAKLAQAIVINHDLPASDLAVLVEAGVDYASDLAHVERVTCDVARQTMQEVEGGVPAFAPFIRYHTFGESSIDFTVILRGRQFVDQYLIKHDFIKRLHARYDQEGIVIPFPIRTLVARNGLPSPPGR